MQICAKCKEYPGLCRLTVAKISTAVTARAPSRGSPRASPINLKITPTATGNNSTNAPGFSIFRRECWATIATHCCQGVCRRLTKLAKLLTIPNVDASSPFKRFYSWNNQPCNPGLLGHRECLGNRAAVDAPPSQPAWIRMRWQN